MTAPRIYLSGMEKGELVINRSPYWVVCFVRFAEPCAMHSGSKQKALLTQEPLIVENDCISVSVNNSKNSFAKTCSLTMKAGEIWYPNAVSPGDWVFVWMNDNRLDYEKILNWLMKPGGTNPELTKKGSINGWDSGLKFFGRVIALSNTTAVQSNGVMSINQTVSCQSFVEMANSVYYTYISKALMTADNPENEADANRMIAQENLKSIRGEAKTQSNGLDAAMTSIADKFINYTKDTNGFTTPEEIIAVMFILIMGVEKENSLMNVAASEGLEGSYGDAIGIPSFVAEIFGKSSKKKLWQMYNVVLGLQSYTENSKSAAKSLFPNLDKNSASQGRSAVFYKTPAPTKGSVPLQIPPIWDNRSLWQILNSFLNEVVNEMYTCLRMNKHGEIVPTLIVREKPFSTGLFNDLYGKAPVYSVNKSPPPQMAENLAKLKDSIKKSKEDTTAQIESNETLKKEEGEKGATFQQRTYYCNLPRWILPESKVLSVSLTVEENKRVNFIQVWGRSSSSEFMFGSAWDQESFKIAQYLNKNFVADEADIARNGLRADIQETVFDLPVSKGSGSLADLFARMRADWYFNGQLKPAGTITLMGIQEPICEGDNIEFEGIVFHITGVSHSASISADGKKSFLTTLQVENGILASSLKNEKSVPMYPRSFGEYRGNVNDIYSLKGKTDIQNTGRRKNRDEFGEYTQPTSPPQKKKPKGKK